MQKRLLANDLYQYLVGLADLFAERGDPVHANRVRHVSKFAGGSTSELYGEARLLLPRVLTETSESLPELDRARLSEVISLIEAEFRRIGGA
jgi:hypothetical protein